MFDDFLKNFIYNSSTDWVSEERFREFLQNLGAALEHMQEAHARDVEELASVDWSRVFALVGCGAFVINLIWICVKQLMRRYGICCYGFYEIGETRHDEDDDDDQPSGVITHAAGQAGSSGVQANQQSQQQAGGQSQQFPGQVQGGQSVVWIQRPDGYQQWMGVVNPMANPNLQLQPDFSIPPPKYGEVWENRDGMTGQSGQNKAGGFLNQLFKPSAKKPTSTKSSPVNSGRSTPTKELPKRTLSEGDKPLTTGVGLGHEISFTSESNELSKKKVRRTLGYVNDKHRGGGRSRNRSGSSTSTEGTLSPSAPPFVSIMEEPEESLDMFKSSSGHSDESYLRSRKPFYNQHNDFDHKLGLDKNN